MPINLAVKILNDACQNVYLAIVELIINHINEIIKIESKDDKESNHWMIVALTEAIKISDKYNNKYISDYSSIYRIMNKN